MVSDVSDDRFFGEENPVPGICAPRGAIAPAGDVLVMGPHLVIGAASGYLEARPPPWATKPFGIILGAGVLVGRSHS